MYWRVQENHHQLPAPLFRVSSRDKEQASHPSTQNIANDC